MSLYFDEEEAVKKLRDLGYRVVKNSAKAMGGITTVKALTDYFYARRLYYNPSRKFPFSVDYSGDTKFVSSLVVSRQKQGLSRKAAVQESALIIDAFFKYEKHLKLKTPISNPRILTSRPFIDRICSYMNGEDPDVNDFNDEMFIDKWNEEYNKKHGERDFLLAKDERKKILEKLDDKRNKRNRDS